MATLNSMKWFLAVFLCFLGHKLSAGDNWIVVTSIQYPTQQIKKLAQIPGWQLLVVGDKKTPKDWHLENCIYLSPENQLELGYEIAQLLPWNHYSRKNIGYLYAIEHGAKIIYDTDDDNEPLGLLAPLARESVLCAVSNHDRSVNIYHYFGLPHLWPRGFPLDKILPVRELHLSTPKACVIGIEQGMVNESPDVDAIFRLTQNKEQTFIAKPPCFLEEGFFCPCNSQNTFFHSVSFFSLYLPSFVSMRVTDIWRGYIAQTLLWKLHAYLAFSGPSAVQKRNPHVLINDFYLEHDLYYKAGKLIDCLSEWNGTRSLEPCDMLIDLYGKLIALNFLKEQEMALLRAWENDYKNVMNQD